MWKLKKKKKLILPFRVKKGLVQMINSTPNSTTYAVGNCTIQDVLNLSYFDFYVADSHKALKEQVMRDYFKSENQKFNK